MRVASLDVGSNSVLMLVAKRNPDGTWTREEDYAEVTRISQGLDQSGILNDESIARTVAVLRRFVFRARELQVDRILATGTAPFRRSSNGVAVARAISDELGIELDVVSGDQEAELTLQATLASFPAFESNWLVDIGGASTEVILCEGERREALSLDLGVVRLTERHVLSHPLSAGMIHALRSDVQRALRDVSKRKAALPLIGVAGTVTTLAAVDQKMAVWDSDRIQGYRMAPSRIFELAEMLSAMTLEERANLPGLDPRRADVAPAGAWLLHELCETLEVSELVVSDRGLRWGRLFQVGAL